MELDSMIFIFWMLSFKPALSPSSFTFIKRLFSSSSLSTFIRTVSSAYLRLLIFYWYFSQKSWFQFVHHPAWHFTCCSVPFSSVAQSCLTLCDLMDCSMPGFPVHRMLYYASKLNKQGDNIQPWCIPFPILNQSVIPWLVLTVASWPEFTCLGRQVRKVSY